LETLLEKFADNELQYTNTIIDETYTKALTGNYTLYFFFKYKNDIIIIKNLLFCLLLVAKYLGIFKNVFSKK